MISLLSTAAELSLCPLLDREFLGRLVLMMVPPLKRNPPYTWKTDQSSSFEERFEILKIGVYVPAGRLGKVKVPV